MEISKLENEVKELNIEEVKKDKKLKK